VNQESFETGVEPITDDSPTYFYKLWPKMDGFDVWKTKVKQAGALWNADIKCWMVKERIPGLERNEMTAEGEFIQKKKPAPSKAVQRREEEADFDLPPPIADDDIPF
jgi:hypothetical protein